VETNRANALQVEIVCYSDQHVASGSASRLFVADLDSLALADLRAFCEWAAAEYGVGLFWPGKAALSYAQANAPGFRMTGDDWYLFGGVAGHQHVPENDHWDPGALAWEQIITGGGPTTPGDWEENELSPSEFVRQLDVDRINALVMAKVGGTWVIAPTDADRQNQANYWAGLLPDPNNPEWADFYRAVLASGQMAAAIG
jgi:hypothetical protein